MPAWMWNGKCRTGAGKTIRDGVGEVTEELWREVGGRDEERAGEIELEGTGVPVFP